MRTATIFSVRSWSAITLLIALCLLLTAACEKRVAHRLVAPMAAYYTPGSIGALHSRATASASLMNVAQISAEQSPTQALIAKSSAMDLSIF